MPQIFHAEKPVRTNADAATSVDRAAVPDSTGYGEPEPEFVGSQPNRFADTSAPEVQFAVKEANWAEQSAPELWETLPFDENELQSCLTTLLKTDVELKSVRELADDEKARLAELGYGSPLLVDYVVNGKTMQLVIQPLDADGFVPTAG